MNPIKSITQAKSLFDQMGGDPHTVYPVLRIAQTVGNDPQKMFAILRIAKFLSKNRQKKERSMEYVQYIVGVPLMVLMVYLFLRFEVKMDALLEKEIEALVALRKEYDDERRGKDQLVQ